MTCGFSELKRFEKILLIKLVTRCTMVFLKGNTSKAKSGGGGVGTNKAERGDGWLGNKGENVYIYVC